MRPKWNHIHGITNVWQESSVRGRERIRRKGLKSLHANQKPLKLMERIIKGTLKNSRCLCRTRKPRYVRVRNSMIIKAFEKRDLWASPWKVLSMGFFKVPINSSTEICDVVWEPFGGLCSATVASLRTGRSCYAAEVLPEYFDIAAERITKERRESAVYERKHNFKSSWDNRPWYELETLRTVCCR